LQTSVNKNDVKLLRHYYDEEIFREWRIKLMILLVIN